MSEYIKPMLENHASVTFSSKKASWIWTRSYIDNIAYAIYRAATSVKIINEVFNLGDIHLKEIELAYKLKELTGWKGQIIPDKQIQNAYNYDQNLLMECSRIRQMLNYVEPVDIETALSRTIQCYC